MKLYKIENYYTSTDINIVATNIKEALTKYEEWVEENFRYSYGSTPDKVMESIIKIEYIQDVDLI